MLNAVKDIPEGRFYSGGWVASDTTIAVSSPTGSPIGLAGVGIADDVAIAASHAKRVQPDWASLPAADRSRVLLNAASALVERKAELTGLLMAEVGATRARAEAEVARAEAELRHSAGLNPDVSEDLSPPNHSGKSLALRAPVGVVGVISPWNAPLVLALRSIAPALALGNAVVHKPDLRSPFIGGLVIARLFEQAGLPEGLLHVLPGEADVGNAIVTDPHVPVVSFTGSTAVGRKVGEAGGRALKRVCLELGGNNAMIVLEDADVVAAAEAGAHGTFAHQGQICMATGRHLVHESLYERYLAILTDIAGSLKVGDPAVEEVDLGPLIDTTQAERVSDLIEQSRRQGARLVAGGTVAGPFVQPTVLADAGPGVVAYDQEIFGPVAVVTRYRTHEELLDLLASSEYQLTCAIWTSSTDNGIQLARHLGTGCAHVNGHTVRNDANAPFGAFGLSGNGAYFGGGANVETFTRWRWITATNS